MLLINMSVGRLQRGNSIVEKLGGAISGDIKLTTRDVYMEKVNTGGEE